MATWAKREASTISRERVMVITDRIREGVDVEEETHVGQNAQQNAGQERVEEVGVEFPRKEEFEDDLVPARVDDVPDRGDQVRGNGGGVSGHDDVRFVPFQRARMALRLKADLDVALLDIEGE